MISLFLAIFPVYANSPSTILSKTDLEPKYNPDADTLADNPSRDWKRDPLTKKLIGDPNSWINIDDNPDERAENDEHGNACFYTRFKTYELVDTDVWVTDDISGYSDVDYKFDNTLFEEQVYTGFDQNGKEEITIKYNSDGNFEAYIIEMPFTTGTKRHMAKYLFYNDMLYKEFSNHNEF